MKKNEKKRFDQCRLIYLLNKLILKIFLFNNVKNSFYIVCTGAFNEFILTDLKKIHM